MPHPPSSVISGRGGVLGAMDTMYQRGKIQDESMYYPKGAEGIKPGPIDYAGFAVCRGS